MTLPLSLLVGLRFSFSHRGGMVSLISLISTISIIIGISILIIGLSVMNGFEHELHYRLLDIVSHGEIEIINQPWKNWKEDLRKIEKIPGIAASAPYINFTGLLEGLDDLFAIQVKGIDPQQEERLSTLSKFLKKDDWINFKSGQRQILIGKGTADFLKLKKGDWISVIIPHAGTNYKLQSPKRIRLHISGIFHLNSQLDRSLSLIPLEDIRQYLNMDDDSITGIAIKVNNAFKADKLVYSAGEVTNNFVNTKSWMNTYGYIYHDIQMIRIILYMAMILVIGLSCFNIVSILMISIKEKRKDVAILCTLGAETNLIRSIFIWYGFFIGIVGSLFGTLFGSLISIRLTSIFNSFEKSIGFKLLSKYVYFIDFLPSELRWMDVFCIFFIGLFLSFLASWYPAYRAVHIDPSVILNNR